MSVKKPQPKSRFLIIYASETGQAKAISEEIEDKALVYGLKPYRFCISLTDKRFSIEKETCVVFVVSTTGDGQPPDTALKFYRRLNRNILKPNHLENLNYTLLALGDSNYLKFAAFGRQLEHRLKDLSAKCFYPTGYGDDAFGIETGVDPWLDNLWPVLHKQLGLDFVKKNFTEPYNLQNNTNSHTLLKMITSNKSNHSEENECLTKLSSVLKEIDFENCHVPKLPSPLYAVVYDKFNKDSGIKFSPIENTLILPASSLVKASLISSKRLTFGDDVKDTLELIFKFEDKFIEYDPGDSFGFICPNESKEVDMLLNRLNLLEFADVPANLVLHEEYVSKRKLPGHIPSLFSLRDLFLHHIEIRAVPKKILLRIFAEYTEIEEEKQCLCFLSSQEGSNYFTDYIRKPSLSVLDILLLYKSCKPPIEKLIEYLPALKPRFYSVASSPLIDKDRFKIVFNVLEMKSGDGRQRYRKGVCTGWFNDLSSELLATSLLNLTDKLSALTFESDFKTVFIYKRKNLHFKFPDDLKTPVIMVGPGTGIAPFLGYLQHREKLMKMAPVECEVSETWLFYGCRYKEKDYLFREELQRLVQNKVLQHLIVSFSRETTTLDTVPRYVHESIQLHAQKVTDCIKSGGQILVCGDAKHMVHDVQQAFIKAFEIGLDIDETTSNKFVMSLQKQHRYINDVWA